MPALILTALAAAAQPVAATACPPEHAAMGHCTPPAPPAVPPAAAPTVPPCPPEHAAMGHCTPTAPRPNAAAPPPATPDYADRIWGAEAMRASRAAVRHEHGGMPYSQLMFDIAELQLRDGRDGWRIEGEGWFGGDINRLLVRFEGEGDLGRAAEQIELQAVYSRAIGPYFNLQAGLRHDVRPDPSRTHAVFGIEGLAPYWFEIEALAFLSTKGELTGRFAASYDQRLTQRLVLQPRVELNLAAAAIPERGIAAGLSDGELDFRLRYEIAREFAPYLGVSFGRRFGRFARSAGEGGTETSIVIGVRGWF